MQNNTINDAPAISVLMPAYNAGDYIAQAIESILNQTFEDFEFIIINDGSTDSTGAIIDDYAARDSRIRAFHRDNHGLVATLNFGLDQCRGPYIARMDADDWSYPQRLEKQYIFMQDHPEVGACGTFVIVRDEHTGVSRYKIYKQDHNSICHVLFNKGSGLDHPSVIMRSNAVREINGYRQLFEHVEDKDLWLRMSEISRLTAIPEYHFMHRHHGDNISLKHSRTQSLNGAVAAIAARYRARGLEEPCANWDRITWSNIYKDLSIKDILFIYYYIYKRHYRSGVKGSLHRFKKPLEKRRKS